MRRSITFVLAFALVLISPIASAATLETTPAMQWVKQDSGTTETLYDICFVDSETGWVVGANGTVLHTEDGGQTWASQVTGASGDLSHVDFVSEDRGWLLANPGGSGGYAVEGVLLMTSDGGQTWEEMNDAFPSGSHVTGFDFIDAQTGWAAVESPGIAGNTQTIYRTDDAGATWTDPGAVDGAAVGFYFVQFIDAQTGWASDGTGFTIRTTDGGTTWSRVETPYWETQMGFVEEFEFVDANTGWALSTQSLVSRTTDGGQTWPVVYQQGGNPADWMFTDTIEAFSPSLLYAAAAVGSNLFFNTTRDGGGSWSTQIVPINTGELHDMFFVDEANGWIVGYNGSIVHTAGLSRNRLSGQTRYDTAIAISKEAFPSGADTVVIATGQNYPDALAGAALADAFDAPLLIVPSVLPDAVKSEILRLHPTDVLLLGGEDVVSRDIADWLTANVTTQIARFGGDTRYDTAALIANQVATKLGGVPDKTAIIATGLNFPDALAGSPLSAAKGWPILLVRPDSIPPATKQALTDLGITRTIVLGQESAVSAAVAAELPGVTRLGGADRYGTMGAIAEYAYAQAGLGRGYVSLAVGSNFPDALTGGVLTAQHDGVMLLTPFDSLTPAAQTYLNAHGAGVTRLDVYGGEDVVQQSVVDAAVQLIQ